MSDQPEGAFGAGAQREPKVRWASYLGDGEYVNFETVQHIASVAADIAKAVGLLVLLAIATWAVSSQGWTSVRVRHWLTWALMVGIAFVVLRLCWALLVWRRSRLIVTNEKVMHVFGVFNRRVDSTPLSKIADLSMSQPLLGRVFGYGRLIVADDAGNERLLLGMNFTPKPAFVYRTIADMAQERRLLEGGAHMPDAHDSAATPQENDR